MQLLIRKVVAWGLFVSLGLTVSCAVLMALPEPMRNWFRSIHPVFGWTMFSFACVHVLMHRRFLFPPQTAATPPSPSK